MDTGHAAVLDTKICPYCREVIKADAVKCRHCQTILPGPVESVPIDSTGEVRIALGSKYDIIAEIGRGGMATVYKGTHKGLSRSVALKVLPRQYAQEKELLDRFHREARALAQLKHPAIVPVYDVGFEGGIHYFAMEYLEGETLSHLIARKKRISVHEVLPIIAQVAEALDYIHANNLVHRDVKSANIIIDRQGHPVLMDFGVAHQASNEALTAKGMILGTPEFMSPEQASGREVDGRSDLYSLGVVLYQSLTGTYPHKGETPLMTLHKVITEPPPPLRSLVPVPEWVEEAARRCLEKDPNSRVQNGAELIRILRHGNGAPPKPAQRRSNGSARPAPQPAAGRAPAGRRTGMIATAIVCTLLVFGAVAWYAWTLFMKPPPVPVPDISGSSRQEAEAKISGAGLRLATVERRWGTPEQHDLVIEQRPPAGSQVPPGSRIVLVLGIGKTVVPDLIGAGIGDAVELLQKNALAVGETTRVAGPPEQRDRIILMYPQAGTTVETRARVNLSIGE